MSTNCLLLPTEWCLLYFRNTIIENNCTDIKKTVNFHVTTVVNKDSFLCRVSKILGCVCACAEHAY